MKHVLITGSAGFIGSACVEEFVTRGWQVTALIHNKTSSRIDALAADNRIRIVRADISDLESLRSAVGQGMARAHAPLTVVVNCAGRASDLGRDTSFRKANYGGVRNLVACIKNNSAGRLVQLSTTDVYGIRDFSGADEDTPMDDNRRNPYPKYKILSEKMIRSQLPPERYVILRPAAVWGPGDTTLTPRIVSFLRSFPFIVHFGRHRGRNIWHLAHIKNVALAVFAAASLDEACGEAYNVADREKTSIDEFYMKLIENNMPEKKIRRITIPFAAGWMVGAASSVLGGIFDLDTPLFDPTLYGLYHVSSNLDFSTKKLEELMEKAGLRMIEHDEAWRREG